MRSKYLKRSTIYTDKYGISKMNSSTDLFNLTYDRKKKLEINDYIKILEKLAQLEKGKNF